MDVGKQEKRKFQITVKNYMFIIVPVTTGDLTVRTYFELMQIPPALERMAPYTILLMQNIKAATNIQ